MCKESDEDDTNNFEETLQNIQAKGTHKSAIEAFLRISLWGKNLASSSYSTVITLSMCNTDEYRFNCGCRPSFISDRAVAHRHNLDQHHRALHP